MSAAARMRCGWVCGSLWGEGEADGPVFGKAAWSPDGTAIAYDAYLADDETNPSDSGIFVSPSRTGQPRRIVSYDQTYRGDRFPYAPSWSPDGEWIVYVWSGEPSAEIWLVRANGTQRHQLTKQLPLTDDSNPVWLPSAS